MQLTLKSLMGEVAVKAGPLFSPYAVKRDGREFYELHLSGVKDAVALGKRIIADELDGLELVWTAGSVKLYALANQWALEVEGRKLSPFGLISLCRYLAHRHGVNRHTSVEADFTFYGFHRHNPLGWPVDGVHIMGFELTQGIITHGMSDQEKAVHVYTSDPAETYTLGIRLGTHGYPWWDQRAWLDKMDGGSLSYAKLEKLEYFHEQIRNL